MQNHEKRSRKIGRQSMNQMCERLDTTRRRTRDKDVVFH
jgi:hypothetical protein